MFQENKKKLIAEWIQNNESDLKDLKQTSIF